MRRKMPSLVTLTNRDGNETIKVVDLINALKRFPDDYIVSLYDGEYYYGADECTIDIENGEVIIALNT